MHPVKMLGWTARTTLHTVRHPVSSAAYAAGVARGLAGAVLHSATGTGHDPEAGPRSMPAQRQTGTPASSGPPKPQRVAKPIPGPGDLPEPIVIEATDEPGESFATEPKAVSRESAHGGGRATDAEIDAWMNEAMARDDVDIETPVGTTGAEVGHNPDTAEADLQQPGTPPVPDPGVAKSVRSECEILRKDADRDPE